MKKLTLDILDSITSEYSQYQTIKPDEARFKNYTGSFFLDNQTWAYHYNELKNIAFSWNEFKYSDIANKKINIDEVVPQSVGIYLFIVKPHYLIFDMPKYVYYVGIAGAQNKGRTLNERLKDYFAESNLKKRDAVRILIHKHYDNIYIGYSPISSLPNNTTLEEVEKSFIGYYGTHLLANRDDIPVALKSHTKAFNI